MIRETIAAGGDAPWSLSVLRTPPREADVRILVVTGTPSWPEYWAPTLAALPAHMEMLVPARPGFEQSEPESPVLDLAAQARALSPLLETGDDRRVVVLGQSYGAGVALTLAELNPERIDALILMSPFLGRLGPTGDRLTGLGRTFGWAVPRDLKNALAEVRARAEQLPGLQALLPALTLPVTIVHGDADTFVRREDVLSLVEAANGRARLVEIEGGDHFLNACCVPQLIASVEAAAAP